MTTGGFEVPRDVVQGEPTPHGAETEPAARAPLSPAELEELARAQARLASLRRAGGLAALNGWSLAGCAALCVPLALADPALLFVAIGLGAAGWAELRGRTLLRVPDPRAPRWLAWNQLATFLVVLTYCAWRVIAGLSGPSPSQEPGLSEVLDTTGNGDLVDAIDRFYPIALVAFYGIVVLACAAYQGGCAFYYLGRREPIERYLAETPAWVREVQRALGGGA